MSEQPQSNLQTFGAGLLGFVAVMAIGGGALMVRSSQQAKAGAKPVAAAAPIDLGFPMPRAAMSPTQVQKERRAQSPAPLMGAEDESESPEAAGAAAAAAKSPDSAPNAQSSAARLEVTQHLDKPGNGSSATAIVKNTAVPEKGAKAEGKKALPKLAPAGGGPTAIASVHYGVTSRNELMGRAAGPVYNIKGGAGKGGSVAAGKMAGDVNAQIADIQRQLENSGLPADQRAKLEKDLAEATKGLDSGKTTAQ